jgi:hypothetical protein
MPIWSAEKSALIESNPLCHYVQREITLRGLAMQLYIKNLLPSVVLGLVLCLFAAGVLADTAGPGISAAGQDVQSLHDMVHGFRQDHNSHGPAAIISVLLIFGAPVLFVALGLWFRYKQQQLIHKTISEMVSKGMQIPPQLLQHEKFHEPRSALHKGVVMTALGVGLLCLFLLLGSKAGIGASCIVLFLGFAFLLIWRMEKPRRPT